MKINLKVSPLQTIKNGCVMVGVYENGDFPPQTQALDTLCGGAIKKMMKQSGFTAKLAYTLSLYNVKSASGKEVFEHILLVGAGKAAELTAPHFRKLIFCAIKALSTTAIPHAYCYLTELTINEKNPQLNKNLAWKVKQISQATVEAIYRFDLFKSKKDPAISLRELTISLPDNKQIAACELAVKQGKAIANGMNFAKTLGNLPSNICTPSFLAEQAKDLAKSYRNTMKVRVLDEKQMRQLGMGAILAVSQGSAEEAKLICLEYTGTGKKEAPFGLVGKGITFDTGGNSLKSPDSMVGMKYDMCGAATVLGTIKAAAELKLAINLVGIIPAVENMPGGSGYKPEDILTSMSGQTIEVISTDAEGRLVLADALTYCEQFKPQYVIDIATLTGAVVIALGTHATGLLSNDDEFAQALLQAGIESNDRAWQLPLWDEYQEQLKSPFADMSNTGGRPGGTITAACFLSRFAKKFKWAHLDVAGTAANMMVTSDRLATGRPIPLIMQFLISSVKQ